VDELGGHGHRQWAVGEHQIVKCVEVERSAGFALGRGSQARISRRPTMDDSAWPGLSM